MGDDMSSNRLSKGYRRLALCAALAVFSSGASVAVDDHEHARQALAAGEVLPLRTILERVERDYPGQVLDVELERGHENDRQRWVYEIKVLRPGGALVKLKVDARDASVIDRKFRDAPPKHRHSGERQ